tara:strand:- start:35 stop:604 length:570 start_codon:yes stop_codon:yes gene_type:complete
MSGESKESFSSEEARIEIKNSFLRRPRLRELGSKFSKSLQAYTDVASKIVREKDRTNRIIAGQAAIVGLRGYISPYEMQKEANDTIKVYTKKLKPLIKELEKDNKNLIKYEKEWKIKDVVPEIVEARQSMYKKYFTDVQEKIKPYPRPRNGRGGKRKKTRRRKRKSHKKRNKGKRKTKKRRKRKTKRRR